MAKQRGLRAEAIPWPAPTVDEHFGHWFAGFVDGEGCFDAKVYRGSSNLEVRLEFSIILRSDDRTILEEIRARLCMGIITDYRAITNRQGIRSNPRSRWRVTKRDDCIRLAELFERFPLRAKKSKDAVLWSAILRALGTIERGNRWHGSSDRSNVVPMVEHLREVRKFRE